MHDLSSARDSRARYYLMYILAMLIFGTNGLVVARLSIGASQIVLLRTVIGGILLTGVVALSGGFDRTAVRAEAPLLLLGGTALGFNWVALFEAYRMLNVSLSTLIYYIGPMLILLLSPVLFKERLTGRKITALTAVAAGLVCITGSIASGGMSLQGLLTAVLSARTSDRRHRTGRGRPRGAGVCAADGGTAAPGEVGSSLSCGYGRHQYRPCVSAVFFGTAEAAGTVGGPHQLYRPGVGAAAVVRVPS